MTNALAQFNNAKDWQQALYAFLAEKHRRSESRRTVEGYSRDAGETTEDVSRFLDHSSLAVTTVYLRRLEGEQDRSWAKVAAADRE